MHRFESTIYINPFGLFRRTVPRLGSSSSPDQRFMFVSGPDVSDRLLWESTIRVMPLAFWMP